MSSVPSAPQNHSRTQEVRLRRAPKLVAFLILGAVLGGLGGALVALLGPESQYYTRSAVLGFFLVIGVILGSGVASAVALLIDVVTAKRARKVTAQVDDMREGPSRTES